MSKSLRYENGDLIEFEINYQKGKVKFLNGTINDEQEMELDRFASEVLDIVPDNKEFIAAYIGKEVSTSYKKNYRLYKIKQIESKKNLFIGTIEKI